MRDRELACEVVPGVGAAGAAAAALQREIATFGSPLVLASADAVAALAGREHAIAEYGASRDPEALQRDLLALGLAPHAPCDVCHRGFAARRDARPLQLDVLAETVRETGLGVLRSCS